MIGKNNDDLSGLLSSNEKNGGVSCLLVSTRRKDLFTPPVFDVVDDNRDISVIKCDINFRRYVDKKL
jgi:hypothetical protein